MHTQLAQQSQLVFQSGFADFHSLHPCLTVPLILEVQTRINDLAVHIPVLLKKFSLRETHRDEMYSSYTLFAL